MLRPPSPTRCLILLGFVSCVLLFSIASRYDLLDGQQTSKHLGARQITNPLDTLSPATTPSATTPTTPTTSPTTSPTSIPTTSPTDPVTTPTTPTTPTDPAPVTTPTSNTAVTPTVPTDPVTSPTSAAPAAPTSAPISTILSSSLSVNQDGQTQTVVVTLTTKGAAAASASPSQSQVADDGSPSSKSGKSTIIGLSVAGGAALIAVAAFLFWKFGRKRRGDEFDDNEAIQWPELNTHGDDASKFASNRSAGFETNSEVNLTRPDSRAGSLAPSATASAVDLYSANQDPYAVPPLPHLNPNQPYRDDPSYYDPYSGPVPQTFNEHEAGAVAGGEAIPMTQIGRSRSPGPQAAYDMGRRSPGPQAAYDMSTVPGAGRQSPGPQAAYAGGYSDRSPSPRSRSPGPNMALGGGRASPGPQAAYGVGGYGRQSPGPQVAYGQGI